MTDEDLGSVVLVHHGVKGMKWGVQKGHPSRAEIKTARRNVRNQGMALDAQRFKAISSTAKRKPGAAYQRGKLKDMKKDFLKNPDRVTALHLTKGEQVAAALFAVSGAGAPVAGHLIGREVAARTIQRRQAKGHYDKK